MHLNRRLIHTPGFFYFIAITGSIFLSAWKIYFTPLINTDAIFYLIATEKLLSSGLAESMTVYNWPFFQLAIAGIHQITGLGLLASAQIIMVICYTLLVIAFCQGAKRLYNREVIPWFALAIILCHPIVNDFRASLIRDPGMIAFVLLAFSEHLRFLDKGKWRHAFLWSVYLGAGFLFRVETLAFVVLGPLISVFVGAHPLPQRLKLASRLLIPLLVACILITPFALLASSQESGLKLFNDLAFFHNGLENLSANINALTNVMSEQLLGEFSKHDAKLALFAVILTITLASIFRALTLPYVIGLGISLFSRSNPLAAKNQALAWGYALIAFVYLVVFALLTQFTTTRYGLLLAIMLLLPLPCYLQFWWQNAKANKNPISQVRVLILCMLAVNGADSLISSDWKKSYLREATRWIQDSQQIHPGSLISNVPYVGYFSDKSSNALVLRAINVNRTNLTETIDTHWLTLYTYAIRVRQGPEETSLLSDLKRSHGKILQRIVGQESHVLYIFKVAENVRRSAELI